MGSRLASFSAPGLEVGFIVGMIGATVTTTTPNPFGGLLSDPSPQTFKLSTQSTPNTFALMHGNNFTYSGGAVTGGTVTGIDILVGATLVARVTGFTPQDAVTFYNSVTDTSLGAYTYLVSLLDGDTTVGGQNGIEAFEVGAGNDTVTLRGGDDTIIKWAAGNLTYNGGLGIDTLSFQAQNGPAYPNIPVQNLVIDLSTGVGQNPYGGTLALTSVENIVGTGGFFGATSDHITGSNARNIIGDGLFDGGDDIVHAGGGNDLVQLSSYTKTGAVYDGGTGLDELRFAINSFWNAGVNAVLDLTQPVNNAGVFAGVTVSGFEVFTVSNATPALETFTFKGNAAANTVTGADTYSGAPATAGQDFLYGYGGNDTMSGLGGKDHLYGGNGNDSLSGGGDADVLYGGAGNDTMSGGLGRDALVGQTGDDVFLFDSAVTPAGNIDRIADFSSGVVGNDDQIWLDHTVFAGLVNSGETLSGAQFAANAGGNATPTSLIVYDTSTGNLYFDDDGGAGPHGKVLFATLTGHPALTAADIVVV